MNNRNNMNAAANSNYGYGSDVSQQPMREEVSFAVPASKCGVRQTKYIVGFRLLN